MTIQVSENKRGNRLQYHLLEEAIAQRMAANVVKAKQWKIRHTTKEGLRETLAMANTAIQGIMAENGHEPKTRISAVVLDSLPDSQRDTLQQLSEMRTGVRTQLYRVKGSQNPAWIQPGWSLALARCRQSFDVTIAPHAPHTATMLPLQLRPHKRKRSVVVWTKHQPHSFIDSQIVYMRPVQWIPVATMRKEEHTAIVEKLTALYRSVYRKQAIPKRQRVAARDLLKQFKTLPYHVLVGRVLDYQLMIDSLKLEFGISTVASAKPKRVKKVKFASESIKQLLTIRKGESVVWSKAYRMTTKRDSGNRQIAGWKTSKSVVTAIKKYCGSVAFLPDKPNLDGVYNVLGFTIAIEIA
jgi:hypothetical protein